MVFDTDIDVAQTRTVGMGQILSGQGPVCLTAVLGSCIGVAVYHPGLQLGILGHVVLPHSRGESAIPGKFADTAIRRMLGLLRDHQVSPFAAVAKIAGGACMFGSAGGVHIGEENARAVVEYLEKASVRIVAQDVGGNCGRRIRFDCRTGRMTVETVGRPPRNL